MEIGIIWVILLCIAFAVIAVFIYRNNVDTIAPTASRIDALYDELDLLFEEKLRKLKLDLNKDLRANKSDSVYKNELKSKNTDRSGSPRI